MILEEKYNTRRAIRECIGTILGSAIIAIRNITISITKPTIIRRIFRNSNNTILLYENTNGNNNTSTKHSTIYTSNI